MAEIPGDSLPPAENVSLYEYYKNTFDVVQADTPDLQKDCFHLRYNVYCLENPFEPANPEQIETDEYDAKATHFLLKHKKTGLYIGTVRTIKRGTPEDKEAPVFCLCKEHGIALPPGYAPDLSLEVSRFAISKTFRQRAEDTLYPMIYKAEELERDIEQNKARIIPCMTLGLIAAIYQQCLREHMANCVAVMARPLARLLRILGGVCRPMGQPLQYHGERQVFTMDRREFIGSIIETRPELADILTDGGRFKDEKDAPL